MLVKRLLSLQRSSLLSKMLLVVFLAFLFAAFISINPVLAQTQDYGLGAVQQWGFWGDGNLIIFIGRLIQIFFGIIGVIAVLIIMYAGFSWMLSQGDPAKIAKARKILTNAIIGLIIIFMAFAITTFVINMLTGTLGRGGGPGNYPGSPFDPYRSAIGRGPIESVFPAPNAVNIPINTWIAVTFKEPIDWDSIHGTWNGENIINNIEICEIGSNSNTCLSPASTTFTMDAFVSSTITSTTDGRTFVITPRVYLGNEDSQNRTFKVKLLPGIETADGRAIFGSGGFGYYEWAFRTNGQLDLDPPEIISTNANMLGVYPMPDNLIDGYGDYQSAVKGQATATFSGLPSTNSPTRINGIAFDKKAEVELTSSTANLPEGFKAMIKTDSGYDYVGSDKTVTMTVANDGTDVTFGGAYADLDLPGTIDITGNTVNTGIGLIIEANGPFVPGSQWSFTVNGSNFGDTFVINTGGSPYRFVFVGDDDTRDTITQTQSTGGITTEISFKTVKTGAIAADSAFYLADAINASQASFSVSAANIASQVVLTATVAGENNIGITKDSFVIALSADNLAGGQSAQFGRTKNGNQDAYNNTIFQINFNEAVNPAFVDSITVRYDADGDGSVGATEGLVSASTTISNQYRTIELKGPHECGVNTCGEQMYCWLDDVDYPITDPTSLRFKVEIGAASLKTCATGDTAWCTGSFGGTCESGNGRCYRGPAGNRAYYPAAKLQASGSLVDGIIDMSGNSFNGSFNTTTDNNSKVIGIAEGRSGGSTTDGRSGNPAYLHPTSTRPTASSTIGDNFAWIFYVSNEIDSYAPLLKTIDPTSRDDYGYASTEDFGRPVWLAFDRLMSYSSLKPGWGYGAPNTKAWHNRYLALVTLTKGANPVGFWTGGNNIDLDGDQMADYTLANIEHNRFDRSVRYSPLAGSGAMSITQNCFLPSRGPANAGGGECVYDSGNPSGCSSSTAPNPASYAELDCAEIEGAVPCDHSTKKCMPLYNNAPATSTGSWVITNDHSSIDSVDGSTGCCLGKCEDINP